MLSYITNFNEFLNMGGATSRELLFNVVEYKNYNSPVERYSILQNEIISHPQDFKDRLNNGVFRIWLTTPYDDVW